MVIKNIQFKLYKRAIGSLILLYLIIFTLFFLPFYQELKYKTDRELELIVDYKKYQIENYFNQLKTLTTRVIDKSDISKIIVKYHLNQINLNEFKEYLQEKLIDILNISDELLGVTRFDMDKNLLANVGIKAPTKFLNHFQLTKKIQVFNNYKINDESVIIFVVPIINRADKVIGNDIVIFSSFKLKSIMSDSNFDKDIKFKLGNFTNSQFNSIFDTFKIENIKYLNNKIKYKIEKSIINIKKIENKNLYILATIDKDKLYSSINKEALRLGILTFLSLLISIFIAYFLSKPILYKLREEFINRKKAQSSLERLNRNLKIKIEKEIEKQKKQQELLMQQSKMAMMGEMLSAIAHQWRQPLHTLALIIQESSFSYELNPSKFNQESINNLVSNSMKQINFMSKTIDDFKNFFKPKKKRKLFSINEVIDSTISLVDAQFKKKDITIINYIESDFKLFAYANELSQVIINLLHNAKDAIREKQKSNEIKDGFIEIKIYKNDKKGFISLSDNGGGIDENIIDRVFEPYFSTKEEGKGTGIGLYMSKIIVENHLNGKIYLKNIEKEAKKGVEFIIEVNV